MEFAIQKEGTHDEAKRTLYEQFIWNEKFIFSKRTDALSKI